MKLIRFVWRMVLALLWLFSAVLVVALIFPCVSLSWRRRLARLWSRALLRLCGVVVSVQGQAKDVGPVLWVANHVSWLDIFVLNSVRSAVFIAKSDIRGWPVIGWLVAASGTIFIERGHRHAIRAVGRQMQARFERGDVVGLFPEGKTSSGLQVEHFYSSLFDVALRTGVDVQPVAFRFFQDDQRSDAVSFVGEQTLLHNMWCLLSTTGIAIDLVFFDVLPNEQCRALGRNGTAELAHRKIQQAVQIC
ncbi:1-acyl-sn-glycerol-3-phosphate acyltransferase [Alcaligenaceae bacterium]|nr:1-acyl-sn-glycerol-3-phosphate acyltransferase [Alcaligenaceae bacterium]